MVAHGPGSEGFADEWRIDQLSHEYEAGDLAIAACRAAIRDGGDPLELLTEFGEALRTLCPLAAKNDPGAPIVKWAKPPEHSGAVLGASRLAKQYHPAVLTLALVIAAERRNVSHFGAATLLVDSIAAIAAAHRRVEADDATGS